MDIPPDRKEIVAAKPKADQGFHIFGPGGFGRAVIPIINYGT